ncbi:MAG: HEAT repeat domain-containing protein [Chitinophagales bacterium]|nr:HEAT repeat domain-containing protein [Chitinophagales bacterium]
MQVPAAFKRLLLIRDEEWVLVTRMFAFEFFQGASIALFLTSSFPLFINYLKQAELPISELSKVFILTSFLLWFFGWLYNKLENMLSVKHITLGVLVFNALSIFLFMLFISGNESGWFYYVMLAWFYVLYLLNNLEFWGLASRLFDVRQSRRLFAIVSAGDIPAKFIGFVAAALVHQIGSQELLWIASGASLLSLLFFHRLISLDIFQTELHTLHVPHTVHTTSSNSAKEFYNLIMGNKLIRQVAIISFFTLCCFLIVNFVFYGYVKKRFETDSSLAEFIAWFLAASTAITLIIKVLFSNRIVNQYGIIRSLLITPVIVAIIAVISFFGNDNVLFYLFGTMAIIIEVLRSAIQSPVLLATLQPLSLHQRLQGHTIMKGIMDPVAFFIIGVLLYVLYHFDNNLNFRILSAIILVMISLWIIWIFSADKNYILTLSAAIRNRSVNERDIQLSDAESFEVLREKVAGNDESDAAFVLRLIKNQHLANKSDLIVIGLKHSSPIVKHEAINAIAEISKQEANNHLHYLFREDADPGIKAAAVRMLSHIESIIDFSPYLHHEDPQIICAAISGIINGRFPLQLDEAEKKLRRLASSLNPINRKCAAEILGEINNKTLQPLILNLLNDPNDEVVRTALQSARRMKSPEIAETILKSFAGKNKTLVFKMLEACGIAAVPVIANFILNNPRNESAGKLINIIGMNGGSESHRILDLMIDQLPLCQSQILHALHLSRFHVNHALQNKYENIARNYLEAAVQLPFKILFLKQQSESELLINALHLELASLRDQLLSVFTLLYDGDKIQRAKTGLKVNTRESIANALELIDQITVKEFSHPFICLYEQKDIGLICAELKKSFREPYLSVSLIYDDILRDKSHDYASWTKACVIYSMVKKKAPVDVYLLEPLRFSVNALLREIANFALDARAMS